MGALSAVLERRYPGIAIQAVGVTFAVFAAMLVAYKTGLIRVTRAVPGGRPRRHARRSGCSTW